METDRRRYKEGRDEAAVPKGKDRRAGGNAAGLGGSTGNPGTWGQWALKGRAQSGSRKEKLRHR